MRRHHCPTMSLATIAFVITAIGACGGPTPTPQAAPDATATPAATPTAAPADQPAAADEPAKPAADVAWKDMNDEQKSDHMKAVVTPKMKAVFQAFDAEEFKKFDCTTCHGEQAKDGKFEMPNAALTKLSTADQFKKHMDEHPKATKWMMETVVPEMAATLSMQPYDPKTKQGFGCFGCHVPDKT